MVEWKKLLKKTKSRGSADSTNANIDDKESLVESPNEDISTYESAGASSVEQPREESVESQDSLPDEIKNYFYPNMDMESARRALHGRPVGTFLLRQSQCPEAKYTLSVKSDKHVFNVRIFQGTQSDGGFHLDAPKHVRKYFPTISQLLRHYSQAPKELIALCVGLGAEERTTFKLMYPLSKSESTLNLDRAQEPNDPSSTSRPVTRQMNGGSLKAMVKWL